MKVTLTFTDCTVDEASSLMSHAAGRQVDQTEGTDLFENADRAGDKIYPGMCGPLEVRPEDREEANISGLDPAPSAPAPRKRASRAKAVEAPAPAAPVPPPAPAAPVPPVAAPVPPPAPAVPVPPPPPPQNFNAAELVETFPQFMLHITPRLASGELTTAKLKLVTDALGLEGLGSLATQTNLIGRAMDLLK